MCAFTWLVCFHTCRAIKRIFPPIVTGVTIMLIGIHLTGAGFKVSQRARTHTHTHTHRHIQAPASRGEETAAQQSLCGDYNLVACMARPPKAAAQADSPCQACR